MKTLNLVMMAILLLLQGAWIWGRDAITMHPSSRVIVSDCVFLGLLISVAFWKRFPLAPVVAGWAFLLTFSVLLLPESFRTTIFGFIEGNLVAFLIVCSAHVNLHLRASGTASPTVV